MYEKHLDNPAISPNNPFLPSPKKRPRPPRKLKTVRCSLCGKQCSMKTAHLHQAEWIGDECCWDERLRASE